LDSAKFLSENEIMTSAQQHSHEKRTMWVVLITAVTMVVEIVFGLTT